MFTIQVNIDNPGVQDLLKAVTQLSKKFDLLARYVRAETEIVVKELDDLTAAVQADTDAENSAITLIQGLAAQIQANAADPAKIAELAAKLTASSSALAAAVVANTPAA